MTADGVQAGEVEQRARELLAAEYQNRGHGRESAEARASYIERHECAAFDAIARACVSSATEALRAERDAAFRMSRCECAADECCANLVKHQQRAERLAEALRVAEAALADIGDADREPGDDVAWCERRAVQALPTVRAALEQETTNG